MSHHSPDEPEREWRGALTQRKRVDQGDVRVAQVRIAVEPVVDERNKGPADEDDNPDIVEAVPSDGDSFRVGHQGVV